MASESEHQNWLEVRVKELEAQNAKLSKINKVLMDRVEAGAHQNSTPYAAFEHSVSLAELVKVRTEELHNALAEIKLSNRALEQANSVTARVSQQLEDAIESISDAFALFDSNRRLLRYNRHFENIWTSVGYKLRSGDYLTELDRIATESGLIAQTYPATDNSAKVYLLSDGRWIQMSERATAEGGLVLLYTDISELIARETQQREDALAQQAENMKRTIDNLSQGVVLVDENGIAKLWNDRFIALTGISDSDLELRQTFSSLIVQNQILNQHRRLEKGGSIESDEQVFETNLGQILEIRTHALKDGSSVYTFTDITERYAYEESLRQSEQWIRLITDNVPAMIAYVDKDKTYRFTNKVYDRWFNVPSGALVGRPIARMLNRMGNSTDDHVDLVLKGWNQTFEVWERNAEGELRRIQKAYVANYDAEGKPDGFFVMNRDITSIHRHAQELESARQNLEQRVEERTNELLQLNSALACAKDEAERANESKSKFLAAVSHDLLQPLNAARLFSSSLEEKLKDSDHQPLAGSINTSLDDVESLLRTLVDISKLDAGLLQAEPTVFPASQLLDNLAAEFKQIAGSQGLQFEYLGAGALIRSDSQLLARIVRNLLTNAVRYTISGKVGLRARSRGDRVDIQIYDTGPGISRDDTEIIFQEFRRLSGHQRRNDRGLGLGLAIVDKISRVLEHRVTVRSKVGKGSIFSVSVPREVQHSFVPQAMKVQTNPNFGKELNGSCFWLIDNDEAICLAMRLLLENWGAKVVTARSLEELEAQVDLLNDLPDALICDYHLDDGATGIEAAQALMPKLYDEVPVLVITANYSKELNTELRQLGYHLMNKPVKPLRLKTLLTHLCVNA